MPYVGEFKDSDTSIQEFRRMYAALDFFDANIKLINSSFEKAMNLDYERKVRLKDNIERAKDLAAGILINPALSQHTDLIKFIDGTLTAYLAGAQDPSNLKFVYNEFINKMKLGLLRLGRGIPEVHQLLMELKTSTHIYSEIQTQNLWVADDFKSWFDNMDEAFNKLEIFSKRLLAYK